MNTDIDTHDSWMPWSTDAPRLETGSLMEIGPHAYGIYTEDNARRRKNRTPEHPEDTLAVVNVLREEHPNMVTMQELCNRTGLTGQRVRTILTSVSEPVGIYEEQKNGRIIYYGILDTYRKIPGVEE